MTSNVLVLAEHAGKLVSDATYELLGKARELADAWGGRVEVLVLGAPDLAGELGAADVVLTVEHPSLEQYQPEAYEVALRDVLAQRAPRLLMVANATAGMDLGAALSVHWSAPLTAYVNGLVAEGPALVATAQILGGKMLADVVMDGERAIVTVLAGAFAPATASGDPDVVALDPPPGLDSLRTRLIQVSEPQEGDVDITAADLLVSVGRGIGSKDNLEVVEELADALGVPLSASRPVIDSGWLAKTRQVGKSGLKVKPKVYLSFGISGAPEHLEGMRGAETIIACNTDEQAPIFEVAHYGTTVDLFDLIPELVDRLKG
ncbi:MAG TPA: electron transfer flavoprotein subunit alpha/FixB family protein [Thermomicrobiaceae bacterium]|nr:electron transfer flavoprotein subunit alpha/FixB family protein [Thermomicrobiaceae bacterium]